MKVAEAVSHAMPMASSSAPTPAGQRPWRRSRQRSHDRERRPYRPSRYRHAVRTDRPGDSSFSSGGYSPWVSAGLRTDRALAVAERTALGQRGGEGMMAVVTDRRILERVVAIIRDAKPVERPIIPERVAPPARGGGQRKKLSPPPKVATGSEASPVVSGVASEVVGASSMAAPSPAQSRIPSGEGGVPAGSAARGFDIDEMNREYALVLMGSKSVVYYERANAGMADAKRFL